MQQLFLIIGFLGYTHSAINCKNPSGSAVDWFILYKLPRFRNEQVQTDGTEFFYMDENNQNFRIPNANIAKTNANPLFKTLQPIYTNSPLLQSYAMYNDQPPSGQTAAQAKAHSKGTIAFDKKTGFWMISSIPRFPAVKKYHFSDEQTRYGQIVLCVTVPFSVKEIIENVFRITNPYIYDGENFVVGVREATRSKGIVFKTENNNIVGVFAKSAMFGKDIYAHLISPVLNEIHVQTWRPNLRNTRKVKNIEYIDFENGISYEASLDHSKWAVAKTAPVTCIGDINRRDTQFKRGGLSLCLKNENVAESFRNLYSKIEEEILLRGTCSNPIRKKIHKNRPKQ